MADYSVDIKAKLSGFEKVDQLEKKINSLKNNTVKINVELAGNAAKLLNGQFSNVAANASKVGKTVGKGYSTALQKQIETVAKTQKNAFSIPLNNTTKNRESYIDWWSKELGKSVNANYGKNQQIKAFDDYTKQLQIRAEKVSQIQRRVSQGYLDAETSGIRKSLNKFSGIDSGTLKSAESSYKKLISLQRELKTGISDDKFKKNLSDKDIFSKYKQYGDTYEKIKNQLKVLGNEYTNVSKAFNAMDASTASNKTLTWLNNNTKAMKKYGDAFKDLAARQKTATSNKELKQYNSEFRNLVSNVQRDGLTGRSFFHEIGSGLSRIGQFVGTYAILQKCVQTLKQMGKAVLDVDTAMTELRKVSDASDLQLSTYFDEATESAKKYGATISDVISSTADWSRLGYTLEDSKKLSDITTLYQRVGDNMTQEKASESLVSTLQGFKLGADEANHIVDAFNEVGNNFAIGSDGIGEALQRSASSMMAANNTMEQTIGLVTAANEVVQDPARVGNAFKTKFYRNCLYVQKCA